MLPNYLVNSKLHGFREIVDGRICRESFHFLQASQIVGGEVEQFISSQMFGIMQLVIGHSQVNELGLGLA